jgi:ribosomal subunit interface protein
VGIIVAVRVLVHDRTQAIPTRLIGYAERRLERLGRHLDRIAEVELEFETESKRPGSPNCSVQITVRTEGRRHSPAYVHERGLDARATLDTALDKIDRQVIKLKEKMKVERKRAASTATAGARTEAVAETGGGELEHVRLKLQPQSLADAAGALEEGDRAFWVFLDEASGAVNVCFRRPDGGLAVIEPVLT